MAAYIQPYPFQNGSTDFDKDRFVSNYITCSGWRGQKQNYTLSLHPAKNRTGEQVPHPQTVAYRTIGERSKFFNKYVLDHFGITDDYAGFIAKDEHGEYMTVLFVILVDLQMNLSLVFHGIEQMSDEWKGSWSTGVCGFQRLVRGNSVVIKDQQNHRGD